MQRQRPSLHVLPKYCEGRFGQSRIVNLTRVRRMLGATRRNALTDSMLMDVFVTGGTGYLGRAMIGALLNRRHAVRVLARPASLDRGPGGATAVVGDALDPATFADELIATTTLVHLVGTPHPGPSKAAEFERVDLVSIRAS